VVKTEPDWSKLPEDTPPSIRTLLKRCLRKDRRQRLGDAGAVRIEVEDAQAWIAEGGTKVSAAVPAVPQGKGRERLLGVAAAIAVVIAAAGWGAFAYFRPAPEVAQSMRFFVSPPDNWILAMASPTGGAPAPLAVSPDGQRIAFVAAGADGRSLLWVRSLDTLTAQPLEGTEGATGPFWSPDSGFLGFFADGKLKKIDISGGPPISLCDAPGGLGGTWNREGVVVFNPGNFTPLQKVSAAGGTPTAATALVEGENGHRRPTFLPDGRHFLYSTSALAGRSGVPIYLASLDSAERRLLLSTDSTNVLYSQGHLLFLRETTLMAQPLDAERLELTGDAFPIAEQIQMFTAGQPNGNFSASDNGVLVYQTGGAVGGSTQLVWFDRAGKQTGVLGDAASYGDVELSPDSKRVTTSIVDQTRTRRDIGVYDVARACGPALRLTRQTRTQRPGRRTAAVWFSTQAARVGS
jgi:hypothetical protein